MYSNSFSNHRWISEYFVYPPQKPSEDEDETVEEESDYLECDYEDDSED